ncbi:carbamoyltransferase HypF [Sulfurovum sp. XTW-4]|uniref:Carbamoyltransferase n=1 Tax=Sulfurovum xiamenensis TaxID=3019066 RepID=A0ABT7QQK7_9BACT|nr:carbamoyltransferase HypF [Sulfurovum xiamenensis]MDM5263382.1 carbamoyltransferase HypF [Sulfurovum xiamenensis]
MPMSHLERLPLEVNRKFNITGVVQGVGFRPFIYQLADRYHLNGFIVNTTAGVNIELEGKKSAIEAFTEAFHRELPPLVRIDTLSSEDTQYVGYTNFQILQSNTANQKSTLVSPDIAICKNCLQEMHDPTNRRHAYPFINCTNCGPRYSIIETLPYDRPNTSMHSFMMCKACQKEYMDPLDRRFHAQPISCPDCGPTLKLLDPKGNVLIKGNDTIKLTADAIKKGSIVAVKGLGGFHLICDSTNTNTVDELRKRKQRPLKPFAVMFPDIESLKASTDISLREAELITSKEKAIVIVPKRKESLLSPLVAPGLDRIGVFLPYTPLHHLLLEEVNVPLVATSANHSDDPIIQNSVELLEKLGFVVDLILDHDRDILNANDDSVLQMVGDEKITLRMSRGYAPKSMKLPFKSEKKILAVGANQKNSIALIFDNTLIMSPYIGDLNSLEAFEYFERTLHTFKRFYDFEPDVIVYDKHPEYMTTKWAKQLQKNHPNLQAIEVQHHYAHLLAVMGEHHMDGKVLGFAFDGTGYGDDGTIWGGEVMIADHQNYERIVTISPFRLLGGEKAIKEPRRSALSLLFETYTLDEIHALKLPLLQQFSKEEVNMLHTVWEKGMNAPLCSSMGRLFDAVASFADIVHLSSFEGESGLVMEQYVDESITDIFHFEIENGMINLQSMVESMVQMEDRQRIVSTFFNTVVEIIFQIAQKHPTLPLLFSGGVFQNKVLVEKIIRRCKKENRNYYFQNDTAINDGGIAGGQAWHALHYYSTQNA